MKHIVIGLAVLALIIAGAAFYSGGNFLAPAGEEAAAKTYSSAEYGFAFDYPANYFVTENAAEGRHSVVLIEDTPGNRALVAGDGPPGEAPPAITLDIFTGAASDAEAWVRGAQESNFQISPGVLTPLTVGGLSGLAYSWSGLYEGDSAVVVKDGNAYMLSGTYFAPGDPIRADYRSVLASFRFQEAE